MSGRFADRISPPSARQATDPRAPLAVQGGAVTVQGSMVGAGSRAGPGSVSLVARHGPAAHGAPIDDRALELGVRACGG